MVPHTTVVSHVIFSYDAAKENHTTESDIPRIKFALFI